MSARDCSKLRRKEGTVIVMSMVITVTATMTSTSDQPRRWAERVVSGEWSVFSNEVRSPEYGVRNTKRRTLSCGSDTARARNWKDTHGLPLWVSSLTFPDFQRLQPS